MKTIEKKFNNKVLVKPMSSDIEEGTYITKLKDVSV